jgi:diacylglycerol kinase (ATP)
MGDVGRVAVVLNPMAGRGRGRRSAQRIKDLLSARRLDYTLWTAQRAGEAGALARQAVDQGAAVVVAAGGDGTLNEALNGIFGSPASLGILPLGTGNDFARHVGIPADLDQAVEVLTSGTHRRVDVGECNGRYFLNIAGCGFDAVVAERVNAGYRMLHGTPAYLAAVAQSLASYRPAHMVIQADQERLESDVMLCSIANTQSYGGGMRIAPGASIEDGLLDVCVVRQVGRLEFLRAFPRVFRGTHVGHPKFAHFTAHSVTIQSDVPLPVLIDGEVVGTTPVVARIHPAAIEMLLPPREV